MPPEERDSALLWDMLVHANEVVGFVRGRTWDDYCADLMLRRAVERAVQVVGEAAAHVSKSFQRAHAEIPWRPIIAQRHILVHDYADIHDDKIWRVATVHIPELVRLLTPLLPEPPESE